MSDRAIELALRRDALRAHCAVQRHHLGQTAGQIETQLGGIDRGINVVRAIAKNPVLVAGGISLFVLLGPRRILSWIGRGVMLMSTVRRVLRITRHGYSALKAPD